MDNVKMLETGVSKVPLLLSPSLEPQREKLEEILIKAQRRLREFAIKFHWEKHIRESFMIRAEIFDSQEKFIEALLRLLQIEGDVDLPKTVSASLEEKVFMSISPQLYDTIFPEGIETDSFEKLITHELAHCLHVRILDGEEEKMGPIWFFEGFAIFAAGQFINDTSKPTNLWEIVERERRGSYLQYGRVFGYFVDKIPLRELIRQSCKDNFIEWLKQKEEME